MGTDAGLQVNALSCAHQQIVLFSNLSFHLKPGVALIVEGTNGSGKSSLLRLLTGLTTPAAGDIHWQGKPTTHDLISYQQQLHFIGHNNGTKLGLTALENLRLAGALSMDKTNMAESVLKTLQLEQQTHTLAKYLSAGQKRRLALARLFLVQKPLWLIDEPFTGLDTQTQALFLSALTAHLQSGGICVLSTHHALTLHAEVQTLKLPLC